MEDPKTMADSPPDAVQSTWELVTEKPGQDKTDRLRVDTGWLYRTTLFAGATTKASGQVAVALTFVPDRATP